MMRGIFTLSTLVSVLFVNEATATHTAASGGKYTHKATLSENKYHVFWKYDSETITFEVEVATTGWVGFGLSPNGGMAGSDIVIGGIGDGGDIYFKDRYATGNGMPSVDSEQNYELLHSSQSQTTTALRFRRKLDTCDDNDMVITGDTFRVIWAYGPTDDIGYHGYAATSRGAKSILLLSSPRVVPDMPKSVITWDFLMDKVSVPGTDTTYWCKGFDVPALSQKHHVIKYEPIINVGNEAVVHHIIVSACYGDVNTTGAHHFNAVSCAYMPNNLPTSCYTALFAWAVGGEVFYYPENVGLPFGDEQQPKFLLLEIHYDNPALRTDVIDSSGLRLTLTPELRQYDAGMIVPGTGVSKSQAIPPGQSAFTTYGYCNSDCTREGLGGVPNGIKAFAGMLHAHLLGRKLRLRHIRNGVELEPLFADNNYDFNYQEMVIRRSEKVILPGDDLQLECDLSSAGKSTFTYGGLATTDEMCLAFVMYYPRANLTACNSITSNFARFLTAKKLEFSYDAQRYTNIIQSGQYTGWDEQSALENMTWTSEDAKLLETSLRDSVYTMGCMNGGELLSPLSKPYGTYKGGPKITTPYQYPPRRCSSKTAGATTPYDDGINGVAMDTVSLTLVLVAELVTLLW